MKRLGIFIFFDPQGVVDRYVNYLLSDLSQNVSRLIIVCNGQVLPEGKKQLSTYSNEIIERENIGYDGAAYREVLVNYLTRDEVVSYDELILLNDTFYGPFYSFSNIFQTMDKKKCDIWGLSIHEAYVVNNEIKSKHIQSYFMNIRSAVLRSDVFWDFWFKMETPIDFENAVQEFEVGFSKEMLEAGFIIDAYMRVDKYISEDPSRNYNYSQWDCGDLICNYAYPILKRKNLIECSGSKRSCRDAIDYIQKKYNYDISMIWENALRRIDLNDLRLGVGLDYSLADIEYEVNIEKLSITLFVFANSSENIVKSLEYAMHIAKDISIYFIVNDVAIIPEALKKQNNIVFMVNSNNLDYISFLKSCENLWEDNEFIIVINNEALNQVQYYQEIYFNNCWENLIGNDSFIKQIVNLLYKNQNMGMIYPPIMPDINRIQWFTENELYYMNQVCSLEPKTPELKQEKGFFQGRKCFWLRTKILKRLLDKYILSEDLWTLAFPYLIQKEGYYPIYLSNIKANSRLVNAYENLIGRILRENKRIANEIDNASKENAKLKTENYILELKIENAPYEYGTVDIPKIRPAKILLEKLIKENKSVCRFGDGELELMRGNARPWFQKTDSQLAKRLNEVFKSDREDLLLAVSDNFGNLEKYTEAAANGIRHYLSNGRRKQILDVIGTDREYYDAYMSRPYMMYRDKGNAKGIFDLFKELWSERNILLIEGKYMRSGIDNDLFANAKSVRRILGPSENAFDYYEEFMEAVKKYANRDDLILLGLGPTATVLAYDISALGFQAIDLGQIDNEYEWYLMGAEERVPLHDKAVPELEEYHSSEQSQNQE